MTRSELIQYLIDKDSTLDEGMARMLVDSFFDCLTESLAEHQRIELRGFGALSIRMREPRTARNPKTGEQVKLDETASIYFRPGKLLQEMVNADEEVEAEVA